MLIFVALGLVGLVAVLHHKANPTTGQTGTSNGVTIDAQTPDMARPGTGGSSVGLYGTTGSPSPFSGLGSPSSNIEYRNILKMQNPPGGQRFNAFMKQPHVQGSGLLNPLPQGSGTKSKQLLTADVLPALRQGAKV